MKSVIILCTGNSCRSQLAEALWREIWGDEWQVSSAGTEPVGSVHPLALEVLEENGIDVEGLVCEALSMYGRESFDLAITVCSKAHESCPTFPGASKTLHWPFPDPVEYVGSGASAKEARATFRLARDGIHARILRYRRDVLSARTLAAEMATVIAQLPGDVDETRQESFRSIVWLLCESLRDGDPWKAFPASIAAGMSDAGWQFNGIYALRGVLPERRLELLHSAGPPVCATIEEKGGVHTSGMCFDAVLRGAPQLAADVSTWPGYVSCDGDRGLKTVSGIAVPLVDATGTIRAVWDLDSTEPLEATDALFVCTLISRLLAVSPVGIR